MDERIKKALRDDDVQRRLQSLISGCFRMSASAWSSRYSAWQAAERRWKMVVSISDRTSAGAQEYPFGENIVAPFTFSIIQSIIAYLLAVFTQRYPVFEVRPLDGTNEDRARLVEALLDYYFRLQGGVRILNNFFLDVLRYGIGILKTVYEKRVERKHMKTVLPELFDLTLSESEDVVTYEGPRTINVDPFSFYPDPRASLERFQEGQFCGHLLYVPWWWLKIKEQQGVYAFVDEVAPFTSAVLNALRDSPPFNIIGVPDWLPQSHEEMKRTGMVMIQELWIRLIPSDYGLSDSNDVEMWVLVLANQNKVIRAEPSPYAHDRFPFVVGLYLTDAHSNDPVGLVELLMPLQDICSWLINSHIDNVKKVLNEVFIYDPSRIDPAHLEQWEPGTKIPLRPEAYGTPVSEAIYQFPVQLYTQQHLNTLEIILDYMQRLSGVGDILMGMFPATKRSATETAHVAQMGANRMQALAQNLSATAIVPWAEMQLALLQQFLSHEVSVRILGAPATEKLRGNVITVTPQDIQGRYFFPLHDGTAPLDPQKNADLWFQIFELVGRVPSLSERFDVVEIFRYMVAALGIRNIDQFMRTETTETEGVESIGEALAAGVEPEEVVPPGEMERKEPRIRPPLEGLEELLGAEGLEKLLQTEA